VATPAERARYGAELLQSRALFVIKEAAFKALYPQNRRFLEFHDIEIALETASARCRFGGRCAFAVARGAKICALAVQED
ncbi:MAG TPA: 4'-phosphopantetheinyl transferase superfamily protein, partial [Rhodoblastus sp.]|nr:4'-phosphopantetheinyl transferase superfamily protein [Rhodoblastus sp.]